MVIKESVTPNVEEELAESSYTMKVHRHISRHISYFKKIVSTPNGTISKGEQFPGSYQTDDM